jgi:hypothetical protein
MLLSARAGVQLGTELAGLQNLQGKLELEKAEIAARKAKNEYEYKAALNAAEMLPKLTQERLAQAQEATLRAQTALTTIGPAAEAANAANLLATTEARIQTGGARRFEEKLGPTVLGDIRFNEAVMKEGQSKLTPSQIAGNTAREVASNQELGRIQGLTLAANPNALTQPTAKAPFFFSKYQPVDIFGTEGNLPIWATDWKTSTETRPDGTEVVVSQAFNKYTGQPVVGKRKDVAIVGVKSDPDRAKITELLNAQDMAEQLIETLDSYGKKDKGGIFQAGFAKLANMPATGMASVIGKAIGYALQSEATAGAASQITKLNSTILRSVAGSAVTDSERSNTSALLPEVGDLVNPQGAQAKARQTLDYIKTQLQPYEKSGAVKRARLGDAAPEKTPPSSLQPTVPTASLANAPGRPGATKVTPDGIFEFVVKPDGTAVWSKR